MSYLDTPYFPENIWIDVKKIFGNNFMNNAIPYLREIIDRHDLRTNNAQPENHPPLIEKAEDHGLCKLNHLCTRQKRILYQNSFSNYCSGKTFQPIAFIASSKASGRLDAIISKDHSRYRLILSKLIPYGIRYRLVRAIRRQQHQALLSWQNHERFQFHRQAKTGMP